LAQNHPGGSDAGSDAAPPPALPDGEPPADHDGIHFNPSDSATPPPDGGTTTSPLRCSLSILPQQGVMDTSPASGIGTPFTASAVIEGPATKCSVAVDNAVPAPLDCKAGTLAANFKAEEIGGLGVHLLYLKPEGAGGERASCLAQVEVKPGCVLTVLPARGTAQQEFQFSLKSSAGSTKCTAVLSNGQTVDLPCSGDGAFAGSTLGVGTWKVTVTALGGGETGTCQTDFTVDP
jgi:hypothetical protein